MTPAQIKKTTLYRTLAPCIRKQDREELARMLAMVKPWCGPEGFDRTSLWVAFVWADTPQGSDYWAELSHRLKLAGHECW